MRNKMKVEYLASSMIIYIERETLVMIQLLKIFKSLKEWRTTLSLKVIFAFFNILLLMINFMFQLYIYYCHIFFEFYYHMCLFWIDKIIKGNENFYLIKKIIYK